MLEGANAATDPTIRAGFLGATFQIRWVEGHGEEDAEPSENDAPPVDRKVSEPELKVWQTLVADTSELPKKSAGFLQSEKPTISNLAALAFEYSVNPLIVETTREASPILAKPFTTILIERGNARIAGKPVTPFPDASKITKDRLAELVAEAGKKPAAEIHPYLASLTPDERAAWHKWLNDPGDLALPDSVKALQAVVVARSLTPRSYLPDVKGAANIDVGFKITPESLTQHIESLAPEIDKHSRADITLYAAEFGPGLQVFANVHPLPAQKAKVAPEKVESDDGEAMPNSYTKRVFAQAIKVLDANESASGIASVMLQGGETRAQATWLIHDGKATLQQPDAKDDDDSKQPFAATLTKLLDPKEPQRIGIRIQLLSRADAEKLKASSDESAPSIEDD